MGRSRPASEAMPSSYTEVEKKLGAGVLKVLHKFSGELNGKDLEEFARQLGVTEDEDEPNEVLGKYKTRMERENYMDKWLNLREILCDWYDHELYSDEMTQEKAIDKLRNVFSSNTLNKKKVAAELMKTVTNKPEAVPMVPASTTPTMSDGQHGAIPALIIENMKDIVVDGIVQRAGLASVLARKLDGNLGREYNAWATENSNKTPMEKAHHLMDMWSDQLGEKATMMAMVTALRSLKQTALAEKIE